MKTIKYIIPIIVIFSFCLETMAQQGENGPERFFNVKSYKAKITLTFSYRLSQSENSYSLAASQRFQHFFTTTPGQITGGDYFQLERKDKGDSKTHKGDLTEGIDMDAVLSLAIKNAGMNPSEVAELKESLDESRGYHFSFDKYKIWGSGSPFGGKCTSSIYTSVSYMNSGLCTYGEGGGDGITRNEGKYSGSVQVEYENPDINNPNNFILQLNLDNNSYSFSADFEMPNGFKFTGESNYIDKCLGSSDKGIISEDAKSLIGIINEKEGLVYKSPLPNSGMVLSGSQIVTDLFFLDGMLNKEGNWSVKIDWTIYPADMEMPDVFISYKNKEEGKNWKPEDGNDIEAIMEWDGNYKPEIIEWELSNVSAEPGTCLNSKDKNKEYDLEFEESMKENGYKLVKTEDGYTARKDGNNNVGKESILIKSRDFGSYGLLSGKIRINGIWCDAYDKELGNNGISIPLDKNENHIADKWELDNKIKAGTPNNWDEENSQGNSNDGDGLSLYEEYRGLMTKGDKGPHMRLDPNIKEVIIVNEIGPEIQPGLDLFEKASKIKVIVLEKGELPETRIVNSNFATGHNQDQYGVIFKKSIVPFDTSQDDLVAAIALPAEKLNKSPKDTDFIWVNTSLFKTENNDQNPSGAETASQDDKCKLHVTAAVAARFRNETVAHELGHAVGANHHGDIDMLGETLTDPTYLGTRAYDLSGNLILNYSPKKPLKICSPVGKEHGQASGALSCLMRYANLYSWRYEVIKGTINYYEIRDENDLNSFCTSDNGGSNPFGDAKKGQGNCLGRLRVKD
jgi:reprolysin-like metallo-peptidase family M12B